MTRRQNESRAVGFYFEGCFFFIFPFSAFRGKNYSAHTRVFVWCWVVCTVVCARATVLSEEPGKVAGGLQGRTTGRTNFATEEESRAPSYFNSRTE